MAPQELKLTVTKGKLAGEKFVVHEHGSYLVGRSKKCFLRIPRDMDPKVSRKHLMLTYSPQEIKVQDLDSHNGTLVNGEYIATGTLFSPEDTIKPFPQSLKDGDEISIGNTVIALTVAEAAPAKTEPPEKEENPEETIPLTPPSFKTTVPTSAPPQLSKPALKQEEKPPLTPLHEEKPKEEVSEKEETIVLDKAKTEPPPMMTSAPKQEKPPIPTPAAPPKKEEDPIAEALKKQFAPPQPKKPEIKKEEPKEKVSSQEETSVMDAPEPVPPPVTATVPKKEGKPLATEAFAEHAPPMPAGMLANQKSSDAHQTKSLLKIKPPDDTKKNLEQIAKGKVEPPISPNSLGKKKSSPLKVKSPGTGVQETPETPTPIPPASPAPPAVEEDDVTNLETIEVNRDDVMDNIDVDSLVQRAKYKESKRTTKFTVKGPS